MQEEVTIVSKNYGEVISKAKIKRVKGLLNSDIRLRSISNKRYPNRVFNIQSKHRNIKLKKTVLASSRKPQYPCQDRSRAFNSTGRDISRLNSHIKRL
mmetsp:Transcript_15666/g.15466  ORF Transcript_15666/g.15466 Transcript_15666/m.15466 type:complete len:98 (-) Transcript_15666:76-369(-)